MSNQIKHYKLSAVFSALIFLGFCFFANAQDAAKPATLLRYSVIRTLPHDPAHYTQGLIFHDGKIYESAGRYGVSALFEKDLETGRVIRKRANSAQVFAEGLALLDNRLFQLTWREHTAYVYDLALNPVAQLHYETEGWGLTVAGKPERLVISDGSSRLRFVDSRNFRTLREINVHDGNREISLLNELETAGGLLYANIWLTDLIAVIDPEDGRVVAWLDLSLLKKSFIKPDHWNEREHVLNGIAHDPRTGHFYVTGKCWPLMFELAIDTPAIGTQAPAGTATPQ